MRIGATRGCQIIDLGAAESPVVRGREIKVEAAVAGSPVFCTACPMKTGVS